MNMNWNKLYLDHPPCLTWSIKPSSVKRADINIDQCKFVLDKIIHDLESMDILHTEAAALSRLIYRMKNKFRNDKGLKSMVALNKALINYYNIFLLKEYKNLHSIIEMEDGIYILPSKQMVEYVLVRTQGFAKLMIKIESIAKYAAHFLKARIKLGHAWSVALIAYAIVSRIWFCSIYMLRKSCDWYDGLYTCSRNFKHVGPSWIPENQSLPCHLKSWLSLDYLNIDMKMHNITEPNILEQIMEKVPNNTNEINFNPINKLKINLPKLSQNVLTQKILGNESDDIGEVIIREHHRHINSQNILRSDRTNPSLNKLGKVDRCFERSLPKVSPNTEISSKGRKRAYTNNEGKTKKKRRNK